MGPIVNFQLWDTSRNIINIFIVLDLLAWVVSSLKYNSFDVGTTALPINFKEYGRMA